LSGVRVNRNFVSYLRDSTERQGRSGLGIDAQRALVSAYLHGRGGEEIAEFREVETGKGADALARRPELRAALDACRRHRACLLIAKLDRLARNVHFVSGLLEAGVDFVAADMPEANKVMIQMHAVLSEWERDQISARTTAALAAARARGVKHGQAGPANPQRNIDQRRDSADAFALRLSPVLRGFSASGLSIRAQVDELNHLGLRASRGGEWSLMQLQRVMNRLCKIDDSQVADDGKPLLRPAPQPRSYPIQMTRTRNYYCTDVE
jgi:DNA invertase Pin-like site-specific DNA recombinase